MKQLYIYFYRNWFLDDDLIFMVLWLAGEYGIHVKYNDVHVPDSPTMVYIVPDSADAKKVTIHGLRDRGLEVNTSQTNWTC